MTQPIGNQRAEIKTIIVDRLKNNTELGDRIFETRLISLVESELPCALIWGKDETLEHENFTLENRSLTLTIEVRVEPDVQADKTLDRIANQVEQYVYCGIGIETVVDNTLGGLVDSMALISATMDYIDEGGIKYAICSMEYEVRYTSLNPSCAEPVDFLRLHADIDIDGDLKPEIQVIVEIDQTPLGTSQFITSDGESFLTSDGEFFVVVPEDE